MMRLGTVVRAMDLAHNRIVGGVLLNRPAYKNVRQYHTFKNRIMLTLYNERKQERIENET